MSSQTRVVPLRTSKYVCDLCLINISALRSARPVTTRVFATATAQNDHDASRARAQSFQQKRPTQTFRGPKSISSSRHGRPRSYSTVNTTLQAVTTGVAPLSHRRLISLSGPDAAKFLHGLITNNVDSTRLSPFYSAFLDARGRVLWDVFIWVWPELVVKEKHWACYIEVDAGEVESLKKHLKRHKLRSKLTIKDVPTEGAEGIRVWAAWGGAHERVKEWSGIAGLEDPRAPRLYRYLASADRETIVDGLQPADEKFYHVERYIHGVAEGPHEIIRETALPMEVNVDLSGGIDFKKGCYVGQELTIRTKHTGVVRKRILPVRFQPGGTINASPDVNLSLQQQPTSGAEIKALDEEGSMKKGRATGKIIAAIGNVGIATCRLENMTPMRVSAEGGTYKPGMQFGVEVDGKVVHVQPVLHDWFVRRKEVLWNREERKKAILVAQDSDELD